MDELKLINYFDLKKDAMYNELFENSKYASDVFKKLNEYMYCEINKKNQNEERQNTNININISDYVVIEDNVMIEDGVTIDSFTKIEGPVFIGKNVKIGTNCYIRPYSIIGNNVTVGHGSEIKNSIIMDNAKIASLAFIGNSIIGCNSRVGSGAVTSNRRFDQSNVKINLKEMIDSQGERKEKYDTDLDFFGLILGDNSRIGANVVTYPGTHIGKHTFVSPGLHIKDLIPSDKMIYEKETEDIIIRDKERKELKR